MRRLIVETDGITVNLTEVGLSLLEVKSVLTILLEALNQGTFPHPGATLKEDADGGQTTEPSTTGD